MKFDWDDILILGDSFAMTRSKCTDWPMALTLKLTNLPYDQNRLPRGVGYGSTAWWSTRRCLLRELKIKVPKVIVICHTSTDRLYSDDDFGLNFYTLEKHGHQIDMYNPNRKILPAEIIDAALLYYKYLMSSDYDIWSITSWLKEVDSIAIEHRIPIVIHLPCFIAKYEYVSSIGITSAEVLQDLVTDDINIELSNHISFERNVLLANALYDAIMNYRPEQNGTVQNLNLLQT